MSGSKVKVTVGFRTEHEPPGTMRKGRKTLRLGINGQPNSVFYTYTMSDDLAAPYITARELVRRLSSSSSYRQALECIEHCTVNHPNCPKPQLNTLPTRVIDCAVPTRPKIFVTNGASGQYVALSYVWGESQPCTTSENISSRINSLELEELPKTIQDAIEATYGYGLRYLWIDALCILQDSQEDKDCEIAVMGRIYRDAHLTIIAASAQKVGQGFLQDRMQQREDTRIPFLCPDRKIGSVWLSPIWQQYDETVEPVSGRAWCLQERMLSPRSLIYASHTLQYCCQTETINIGEAICPSVSGKRLPSAVFRMMGARTLSQHDVDEARRSWQYILEDYSRRSMTEPSDKLIAISGVASQFQYVWSERRYLAGLWEHTLMRDLLWFKNYQERLPRPEKYRAPSWSWAAVNGHVIAGTDDDSRLDSERYNVKECKILSCSAMLTNQRVVFGAVVSGMLQLHAALVKAFWNPEAEMPDLFISKGGTRVRVGQSYPDSKDEEAIEKVWAIPMRWNHDEVYVVGLIVVAAEERFRRVGYFDSVENLKDLEWIASEEQIITIV